MFLENGYLDFDYIMAQGAVYNFICGGRGIGKTFGALRWAVDHGIKFVLLRRTQTKVDILKTEDFNPFKALYSALGADYYFTMSNITKSITGVYRGEKTPESQPCGYIMALSTIANVRGYDSDAQLVIFDEFIPEVQEKKIKGEGQAFLNALETIGRNRELQGKPPLKLLALSNSNNMVNPIFIELRLVSVVEKMLKKVNAENLPYYIRKMPDRDAAIFLLNKTPISTAKAETSLYRLAGSGEFSDMALHNKFNDLDVTLVRSYNLREFKPVVQVGELCIYVHKSQPRYYVSSLTTGSPPVYSSGTMDLKRFAMDYYFIWLAYLSKIVYFESYLLQSLFENYYAK